MLARPSEESSHEIEKEEKKSLKMSRLDQLMIQINLIEEGRKELMKVLENA